MVGTAITDAILWDLARLHYNSELKRNAEKVHLQDCSNTLIDFLKFNSMWPYESLVDPQEIVIALYVWTSLSSPENEIN